MAGRIHRNAVAMYRARQGAMLRVRVRVTPVGPASNPVQDLIFINVLCFT